MNFWNEHGLFFLICMFFFPRLTLIFSSVAFGGFFWWLGWIFLPRLLVAILATNAYLQSNPVLVLMAWIWAITFELLEKRGARYSLRRPRIPFVFRFARTGQEKNNAKTSYDAKDNTNKYGKDIIDV